MNKKVSVIIVLILVLLIGVGYLAWSKKEKVEPVVSETSQVDTSSWKTYTNSQYGFEIKYPSTWKVQETEGAGVWINPPEFKMPTSGNVPVYFSFGITAHSPAIDEKPTTKMFGNRLGYVYSAPQGKSVYFPSERKAGGEYVGIDTTLGEVDNLNQMLSTFKFIPTPVSVPIICSATEHSCPCATGNYCMFRGAMCLNPASACPSPKTTINTSTKNKTDDLTLAIKQFLINQGTASQYTNVRVLAESTFPQTIQSNTSYATSAYFESFKQPSRGVAFEQWDFDLGVNTITNGKLVASCTMFNVTSEQQAIDLVKAKLNTTLNPSNANLTVLNNLCFWNVASPIISEQTKGYYDVNDEKLVEFTGHPF